jgi:hypothetical protein
VQGRDRLQRETDTESLVLLRQRQRRRERGRSKDERYGGGFESAGGAKQERWG